MSMSLSPALSATMPEMVSAPVFFRRVKRITRLSLAPVRERPAVAGAQPPDRAAASVIRSVSPKRAENRPAAGRPAASTGGWQASSRRDRGAHRERRRGAGAPGQPGAGAASIRRSAACSSNYRSCGAPWPPIKPSAPAAPALNRKPRPRSLITLDWLYLGSGGALPRDLAEYPKSLPARPARNRRMSRPDGSVAKREDARR
jgi:hypothetical protein